MSTLDKYPPTSDRAVRDTLLKVIYSGRGGLTAEDLVTRLEQSIHPEMGGEYVPVRKREELETIVTNEAANMVTQKIVECDNQQYKVTATGRKLYNALKSQLSARQLALAQRYPLQAGEENEQSRKINWLPATHLFDTSKVRALVDDKPAAVASSSTYMEMSQRREKTLVHAQARLDAIEAKENVGPYAQSRIVEELAKIKAELASQNWDAESENKEMLKVRDSLHRRINAILDPVAEQQAQAKESALQLMNGATSDKEWGAPSNPLQLHRGWR